MRFISSFLIVSGLAALVVGDYRLDMLHDKPHKSKDPNFHLDPSKDNDNDKRQLQTTTDNQQQQQQQEQTTTDGPLDNKGKKIVKKIVKAVAQVIKEEAAGLTVGEICGIVFGVAGFLASVVGAAYKVTKNARAGNAGFGDCWLDFVVGCFRLLYRQQQPRAQAPAIEA